MASKNLDLASQLPKQYQNRTLNTLMRALFNNHLSKDESVILHGFVGSEAGAQASDIYLREADLERQVNQLAPVLYSKQGTEERLVTWRELVQRLVTLGVPYDSISEWLTVESLNFVPFIDLDKFANFDEYVWVGKWLVAHPTLPWHNIGFTTASIAWLNAHNPTQAPDYYVIKRGALSGNTPVAPYPGLGTWSDWALSNMWLHKADAQAFQLAHPVLSSNDIVQAIRPILQFESNLKLNLYATSTGEPADTGVPTLQVKTAPNQPPLFDLYYANGDHSTFISSGFFYKEAADQPIDGALGRRIVRDSAADLSFGHSFTSPLDDRPLFLKRYGTNSFSLASPWRGAATVSQEYVKYETAGALINADKLQNFESYYWTGIADGPLPAYNPIGQAEYTVIEAGGTSGWSLDNRWKHTSQLTTAERLNYLQAQRPIIEFNGQLESQLLTAKTALGQLPTFRIYAFNDSNGLYMTPTAVNDKLTDAYTGSTLFADLDQLTLTQAALTTASEQASLLATVRGYRFAQTLLTGYYDNVIDGAAFPYFVREYERRGAGNGQLSTMNVDASATPQAIQLTGHADGTTFSAYSTVLGDLPDLTVNTPYTVNGVTFTLVPGTTAFDATSVFRFDVKSSAFKRANLFIKLGDSYRTVADPTGYLTNSALEDRQVGVAPSSGAGAWKCPLPMFGNLDSTLATTLKQGDLYSHFISIIAAQPGLIGSASSSNNWRKLTKDFSKGGLLKIFNDRLQLLFGMLCQDSADPIALLDFGRDAYANVLNRTREFVEQELVARVTDGTAAFLSGPGPLDIGTYKQLRAYLEQRSAVVDASATLVDDAINAPFTSNSMSLKALTLTAPYLGLTPKVAPGVLVEPSQNRAMLVHHDGHKSSLPTVDFSVLKGLVMKRFKRSNGQETAGFVGGPVPPQAPFARQLWLDLSAEKLYVFDVVSDIGELPAHARNGQFSYNRLTGETWQWNGSWVSLGSQQHAQEAPWRLLDLAATLTAMLLELETELYNACPPPSTTFNYTPLQSSSRWMPLMEKEFLGFCSKYGIPDPYDPLYNPTDPFTWSYYNAGWGPGSSWQAIYEYVYGTSRPDLYPFISVEESEAAFMNDLVVAGFVPPGTTTWSISYWLSTDVQDSVKAKLNSLGKPVQLSVDTTTGALLPPFAFGDPEQLMIAPPPTPNRRYHFGENGPIEAMWTDTLEYVTSKLKTYFRLSPLKFISLVWGDPLDKVDSYELVRPLGRKAHIADALIHGEPINRTTLTPTSLTVTVTQAPAATLTYLVEVASARTNTMRVSQVGSFDFAFSPANSVALGPHATAQLFVPRDGLNLGDQLLVTITDLAVVTVELVHAPFKFEGLSQLYAHYHAANSLELSYSADRARLSNWTPKLAYRFNTLVDTDALQVKVETAVIDSSGYNVYLKETELQSVAWLTGLKVTLLQVGSTQIVNNRIVPAKVGAGSRGDDWVYRVDLTNPKHPALQWYEYDASAFETFYALNGKTSVDEWKRFTHRTNLKTMHGPFMVKGLQALATFIFGVADRAAELGYVFNDEQDPVIDPSTGRLTGWQLLIEQLIDSQFNSPADGAAFVVAPFERRFWFKSDYGYVSDLSKPGSQNLIPGLYTADGQRAPKGSFRVFRDGAATSVTSDLPLVGAMLATSVFEHVLVLENIVGDVLLNEPFLNQHVSRLFLEGFKQAVPTGRPVYGGKYLVGNQMRTNMEGSVQQLGNLYDIGALKSEELFDRASSLVSFDRKDYHADLGTTLPTQLQFWRGMLKSKGTNRAVSSFVNSSLFRSALIDELWAYKVADYGDQRRAVKVELNVRTNDMVSERANYLLLEADELAYVNELAVNGGYDMTIYDQIPFDMFTLYSHEQIVNMDLLDPRGCILIKPDDEDRWNSFSDLGSISYLKAQILATMQVQVTDSGLLTMRDADGREVFADAFEIVDISATSGANVYKTPVLDVTSYMKSGSKVYRETGDYVTGTNPPEYSAAKFKRINTSQLVITDSSLFNKPLLIIAYGPPLARFSPSQLYRDDGGRDTPINNNVIWWDPARGVHSPQAYATVDYAAGRDPARYNTTSLKYKALTADGSRAWAREQVGKVWWNTANAAWMNYSDVALYPNHNDRLTQWGSLADWASIDVFEWVESDVPPLSYSGTGELAVKNYLSRARTWYQRPVVWLYSKNAQVTAKAPLKKQTTTLEVFGDSVLAIDGAMPAFAAQERIAGMIYSSAARTTMVKPYGCIEVLTGDVTQLAGSATAFGSPNYAVTASFTDFKFEIYETSASLPHGVVVIDSEAVGALTYVRVTFASGQTQRVLVDDTPPKAATLLELNFDLLGIKLTAKTKFGHADNWGSGTLTQAQRAARVGAEFGNAAHDIVVRQRVAARVLIEPQVTTLNGSLVVGTTGWVSWSMPSYTLGVDDLDASFGSWAAMVGDFTAVGTELNDIKSDIQDELNSPQPVRAYEERWGPWKRLTSTIASTTYFVGAQTHLQVLESLSLDIPAADVGRLAFYINGVRQVRDFTVVKGLHGYYPSRSHIDQGSRLRWELPFRVPTGDELKLQLEGTTTDPAKLVEYKLDTPHTKLEERNEFGRVFKTSYFYWVKNKETAAVGKKLSVKLAAQQLAQHPGPYAVPQVMKRFNQLDGRPNRYALLSVVNMTPLVRKDNKYKLRITENGSMRDDDRDMSLRPTHTEWKLIRRNQPTRIPKELWDKLVDTMCGQTATGQVLPYALYSEYDSRNGTTSRIGLKQGQVLSDSEAAVATVKGALLNTQVVTYDTATDSFKPSPVSFFGYDSAMLDTYLATPTAIREFMASLWNYADARNVNELFFEVLEDALSASYELADIIKTSFVTLDEVRTVVVEG